METLHKALLPYKEIVANTAGVVTIAQFFSGVFICRDIYKQKSTVGISSMPFIGGVTIGVLMLKYGFLLKDEAMNTVNMAAILLNMLYLVFYYLYSENTMEEIFKPMSYGVVLIAMCLSYAEMESPNLVEFRYGLLVTVLMLLLMGSPLKNLGAIIAEEDASAIPFPMTFMGTIVTFLWLLYGIIINNLFMVVQNFLGFLLCLVQLILIFLYPSQTEKDTDTDDKKKS